MEPTTLVVGSKKKILFKFSFSDVTETEIEIGAWLYNNGAWCFNLYEPI